MNPPPFLPAAPPKDSDADLVARSQAGDAKAFGLLVLKYQGPIQRLIGRMVRDANVVEDIAQETFIRAYRALGQFRGEAKFYTWLYRIAVNTAKKSLLAIKRDPTVPENSLHAGEGDDPFFAHHEPITLLSEEGVVGI
jgi:RNA polymerase sigma-70 factor (ECF subfamily)